MNNNNSGGEGSHSFSNASPPSSQRNSSRKKVMKSQHSVLNFKSFNNEISIFGTNDGNNNPSG